MFFLMNKSLKFELKAKKKKLEKPKLTSIDSTLKFFQKINLTLKKSEIYISWLKKHLLAK